MRKRKMYKGKREKDWMDLKGNWKKRKREEDFSEITKKYNQTNKEKEKETNATYSPWLSLKMFFFLSMT